MTRLSRRTVTTIRLSPKATRNRRRQGLADIRSGGHLLRKHSPDGATAHIRLNGPATHLYIQSYTASIRARSGNKKCRYATVPLCPFSVPGYSLPDQGREFGWALAVRYHIGCGRSEAHERFLMHSELKITLPW